MIRAALREIREEFVDFVEDYNDLLRRRGPRSDINKKTAVIKGELAEIRPAYLFAERIDNLIKVLFGVSILISAITSSFVGFASLSQLVDTLIDSIPGRIAMVVIGLSYLMIATWKLLHLNQPPK